LSFTHGAAAHDTMLLVELVRRVISLFHCRGPIAWCSLAGFNSKAAKTCAFDHDCCARRACFF